jgi:hypothetical protein
MVAAQWMAGWWCNRDGEGDGDCDVDGEGKRNGDGDCNVDGDGNYNGDGDGDSHKIVGEAMILTT